MATRIGSLREKLISAKGNSEMGIGVNSVISSEGEESVRCRLYRFVCDKIPGFSKILQDGFNAAVQMGKNNPRKIVFAAEMGLALVIISLMNFLKYFQDLGRNSVWAILTVVIVFEFSIGSFPIQYSP